MFDKLSDIIKDEYYSEWEEINSYEHSAKGYYW